MALNWAVFLAGITYPTYAFACALGGQEIYLFGDGGIFLHYREHPTIIALYLGLIAFATLLAGIVVIGSLMPETEFGKMTESLRIWLDKLPPD